MNKLNSLYIRSGRSTPQNTFQIIISGGSKRDMRLKFFQFHAVFGKIWQNRMLVPSLELAGEILEDVMCEQGFKVCSHQVIMLRSL